MTHRSPTPGTTSPRLAGARAQRGAVALLFLLTLTISLGSILIALDLTRVQLAQARLQNSLDAGVDAALMQLSGSTTDSTAWVDAIEPWVLASYPATGFARSELNEPLPTVSINDDTLVAEVTGNIRLIGAGFLNLATAPLTARRVIGLNPSSLDIVIAVDVAALGPANGVREAATELATLLLQQGGNRVAIVPFSDTVNLGQFDPDGNWLASKWRDEPWFDEVWRGCVTEIGLNEPVPANLVAQPGMPGSLAPLVIQTEESIALDLTTADLGHQHLRLSDEDPGISEPDNASELLEVTFTYDDIYDNSGGTLNMTLIMPAPNNCLPSNTILPFRENTAPVVSHLENLEADTGSSLLPLGLLWSWRVMNSLPAPDGSRQRAIVIVSDGLNQSAAPGDTTTAIIDNLNLSVTIPMVWCNNKNQPCGTPPPGQSQSYTLTGNLTVTTTSTRQSVSSLNTNGTQIATGYSQTVQADLDDYTLLLCNNLNTLGGAEAMGLFWLTPVGITPTITGCVGPNPDRQISFQPITATNAAAEMAAALNGLSAN